MEMRKVGDKIEIVEPETIVPEKVIATKTFEDLEAELKQAQESLAYVQQRHAEEIAPIQKTVDLFQRRVDQARELFKVEVAKESTEEKVIL